MAESPTISNAPLPHLGMDYAFLREKGIKMIAKLAGSRWTDYNSHDPGITILETLCYAITDLSYRLDFDIADLLAYPSETNHQPLFLTARDILTVNPLTIEDYRKILIDIDGIKNAWLEIIDIPQPELYYNTNNASLSFSSANLAEPVNLRGLYRVLIEKEPNYSDSQLIKIATEKLQQHRNLCEDFAEIRVLPIEEITLKAEIEISDRMNPYQLMVELYTALAQEISPNIEFFNLETLIQQGVPVEDIFIGPQLENGFIHEQQLHQFQRKNELHTSDLIHIILDKDGVETVRSLTISSNQSPTPQLWALDLDLQQTPRLKSLKKVIKSGDIKFYKGQIECFLNWDKVKEIQQILTQDQPFFNPSYSQDIPIPTGNYRELSDYETVQNEFPLTYGIGETGLPNSATPKRKAQAKQLQAYLMVFDQLLANYFAQLDQVKELFSFNNREIKTYFTQSIEHFPNAKQILRESYAYYLNHSSIDESEDLERKNRFLDHLLAQYGEQFTDYSLLYNNSELSQKIIDHKVDFASDYNQLSSNRNQGFNYTFEPLTIDHNISGLKRRIARLLGIDPNRQFLGSSDDIEGFYIVEHILLRPHLRDISNTESESEQNSEFLSFSKEITNFQSSNSSGVTCTSTNHGLKEGDRINIFYSIDYNGIYSVYNVTTDTFDINHDFKEREITQSGAWVRIDQFPDPFSFQISVILPTWPGRFTEPNFKQLIIDTLIAEIPAHITIKTCWFDQAKMQDFETTYQGWLQQLSNSQDSTNLSDNYKSRLIALLELGSSTIQQAPALLGYMTIVKNNEDNIENPFIIR